MRPRPSLLTFLSLPSSTNFLLCPGTGGGTAAPRAGVLSGAGSLLEGPARPAAGACAAGMTGVVNEDGVVVSTKGVTTEGPLAAGVTKPAGKEMGHIGPNELCRSMTSYFRRLEGTRRLTIDCARTATYLLPRR